MQHVRWHVVSCLHSMYQPLQMLMLMLTHVCTLILRNVLCSRIGTTELQLRSNSHQYASRTSSLFGAKHHVR